MSKQTIYELFEKYYQEGHNDAVIARLTKRSTCMVARWRKSKGYVSNYTKFKSDKKIEGLRLIREQNLSSREVAEKLGVTTTIVNKWRREERADNGETTATNPKNDGESSICWFCVNSYEGLCPWFDAKNPKPVEGWDAVRQDIKYLHGKGSEHRMIESYMVRSCPNYETEERNRRST